MKAKITQEGMTEGYWCIIEFERDGKTVKVIRSPFNSEKAALDRAKDISKLTYGEQFERVW